MLEFNYVIKDEIGMHARPAGNLVQFVKGISSTVTLKKGDKSVDANRLFAIMGLGIKHGDQVTFTVEGENEQSDLDDLQAFCEKSL